MRIRLSKSVYFDIDTSVSQLFVLTTMFIIMFVMPIYVHARLDEQKVVEEPPIEGTYTSEAIAEARGRVAGVQTERQEYITIPVLNIPFDTTLRDPTSVPILLGGVFGIISISLAAILVFDFTKK